MRSSHESIIFVLACLSAVVYHITEVYSANCASYSNEGDCTGVSGCLWSSSSSSCYCGSNVTMDICFAVDSSGSIGEDYFDIELEWLSDFVESSLSANARIGIINFSKKTYMVLNFTDSETKTTQQLKNFINNLDYQDSYTNTVGAIAQALVMFDKESNDETTKVFVILTDGNPKMPNGGDTDVCQYADDLKSNDINTYILGVGSNWNPDNVDCLVDDADNDILYVTSFNYSDFDEILPSLTDITCPVDYEVTITEVKVLSDGTSGRTVPFIEIYNPSNSIKLTDLTFYGAVTGSPTSDSSRTLSQGAYLVLYDASYSGGGSNVTCGECLCTLLNGGDYCSNAVYIGCDGTDCTINPSDAYDNTNWYLTVKDNTQSPEIELDTVTWDNTFPNLENDIGYSYELKNKGYDNDQGTNWQASCNIYGSPGYEPIDDCTASCSQTLCEANGATDVSVDGDVCDCSNEEHYYENGCACELVPPPDNCVVYWRKNATNAGIVRDWKFIWDRASTDDSHQYKLCYPVNGIDQCVTLYARFKVVSDFDDTTSYYESAGTVQTVMYGATSVKINCTSVTQMPTQAPIPVPSTLPTQAPSKLPTESPTFSDPYLFVGGDICTQDRCDCNGWELSCVGDDIYTQWSEGSTNYVTVTQRPIDFPYDTDVYWYVEYMGETDDTQDSQGTDSDTQNSDEQRRRTLNKRKDAMRRILSNKYGRDIPIDAISNIQSHGARSLLQTTTEAPNRTEYSVSSDISPTSGYVNVRIQYSDAAQTEISSNEGKIQLDVLADGDDDNDADYELFRLTLHNCSINSTEYTNCRLVYPYELYIVLENSNDAQTNVTEEPMAPWLWGLIFGLVAFLFLLGLLVYRYWWKGKKTNTQLASTQDDLRNVQKEAEEGPFGDLGQGDVHFNPMATGLPNTGRTDQMDAELAKRQNDVQNEKADVAAEKFSEKREIGQVAPDRHNEGGRMTHV